MAPSGLYARLCHAFLVVYAQLRNCLNLSENIARIWSVAYFNRLQTAIVIILSIFAAYALSHAVSNHLYC